MPSQLNEDIIYHATNRRVSQHYNFLPSQNLSCESDFIQWPAECWAYHGVKKGCRSCNQIGGLLKLDPMFLMAILIFGNNSCSIAMFVHRISQLAVSIRGDLAHRIRYSPINLFSRSNSINDTLQVSNHYYHFILTFLFVTFLSVYSSESIKLQW